MINFKYEFSEENNNKYVLKCIFVSCLILYVMWFLNLLNIFIIDSQIFIVAGTGTTIIAAITVLFYFLLDLSKRYVKYILLFIAVAFYSYITSLLTYHSTICLMFPLIYSALFRSKKVVWYTYILTAAGVVFSVIGGYYFGLCDANMVLYTYTNTSDFVANFSEYIPRNENWITNLLFFAFPKIFVMLGAVPMLLHLNTVIDKSSKDLLETQEKNLKLSQALVENQKSVIVSLATIIESRDRITGDHIMNTAKYVSFLTKKLLDECSFEKELTPDYAALIIEAAPLHDIGKIHIPDSILCKNGKLTDDEYGEMKKHPEYGYTMLNKFVETKDNNDYLDVAKEVCLYHHERYDGKGYPRGLSGNSIPLSARIMAVADVLDALLSKRQYKEAYSFEKTYGILVNEKGKQFDPVVLGVLLDNWEEFKTEVYSK